MEIKGLTEYQRGLMEVAQKRYPLESYKIMRQIGSKARTHVARKAKSTVHKVTGNYQKGWKRGKAFKGRNGEIVVRVYNSSPHAHLIEDGHRMITKGGKEVGFVKGAKVLDKSMREFEEKEMESMLSDWIDDLLESGKLL